MTKKWFCFGIMISIINKNYTKYKKREHFMHCNLMEQML